MEVVTSVVKRNKAKEAQIGMEGKLLFCVRCSEKVSVIKSPLRRHLKKSKGTDILETWEENIRGKGRVGCQGCVMGACCGIHGTIRLGI